MDIAIRHFAYIKYMRSVKQDFYGHYFDPWIHDEKKREKKNERMNERMNERKKVYSENENCFPFTSW